MPQRNQRIQHFNAKLKPLLRLARKLNETPSRMSAADIDACTAAGWDDAAVHQAIALCCLANYMNRLVEACGIPADPARGETAPPLLFSRLLNVLA